MKPLIQQKAAELEFDACRFTSADAPGSAGRFQNWLNASRHGEMQYLERTSARRVNVQAVLPEAKSVICLAASYAPPIPEANPIPGAGLIARYARYRDYHLVIRERLDQLAGFVNHLGGPGTRSLAYTDTGPILERDLAERSGLGFIGKHTNLISRQLGNWILLGEILTTVEIAPDAPEKNRCGRCSLCLQACPTAAITAPFELDARRCISYLTIELRGSIPEEFRPAIRQRIFGCDDCLAVCPWNRFARAGRLMRPHYRPELSQPELVELLAIDENEFQRRFRFTPISRAKRPGLLRNVCVALGNVGDAGALPALQRAAGGGDALISEHARWGMRQIMARTAQH